MNKGQGKQMNTNDAKQQLATAHRLAAKLCLDDTIFTHLSCRCPENPDRFYVTPFGCLFQEVTADTLLTLTLSGELIEEENRSQKSGVNPAGAILHSAFYEANPKAHSVVHLHSPAALAVSCLKDGLLPLSQFAMIFYNRLGYHSFEGISLDSEEKSRLLKSLGSHKAMLLHNHGLVTVAESIPQAFMTAYYLERSCAIQLKAQATGQPLILPRPDICEKTAQQFEGPEYASRGLAWDALVRSL